MSLLYQLWRKPGWPFIFMMADPERGRIVFHSECTEGLGEIEITTAKASISEAMS
jgi:hypothetical protein